MVYEKVDEIDINKNPLMRNWLYEDQEEFDLKGRITGKDMAFIRHSRNSGLAQDSYLRELAPEDRGFNKELHGF